MIRTGAFFILLFSASVEAAPWFCSKPALRCMANGDGSRREELTKAHAADLKNTRCLTAGYFSSYVAVGGGRVCALPESRCSNAQVSCNPATFCLMDQRGAQASQCVGVASAQNSEVEFCSAEFKLAQKGADRLLACDPRKRGLAALAEATEKDYEALCLNDPDFQRAFCGECEILGHRFYEMNEGSTERGCAPPGRHDWPEDSQIIYI